MAEKHNHEGRESESHVIIITPTYDRIVKFDDQPRIKHLERLAGVLKECCDQYQDLRLTWIVVEDDDHLHDDAKEVLKRLEDRTKPQIHASASKPSLTIEYLHVGPTNVYGNKQRAHGLDFVVEQKMTGVCIFCDDDNWYTPTLFNMISQTERVSVHCVGNLGRFGIERPVVNSEKKILAWDAGWLSRKFPVDNAGYAFHTSMLATQNIDEERFQGRYRFPQLEFGGETEFIESLVGSSDEIQVFDIENIHAAHDIPLHQQYPTQQTIFQTYVYNFFCWAADMECRISGGRSSSIAVTSILWVAWKCQKLWQCRWSSLLEWNE